MPITKQAIKRNKQNAIRKVRNIATQSTYQKSVKTFIQTVKGGKVAEAEKMLSAVYKNIDTAKKKQIISSAKAARKKSQVTAALKTAGGKMLKK